MGSDPATPPVEGTSGAQPAPQSKPQSPTAPAPLLSLTKGQLQRLRDHLDERLLGLERDERKDTLGPLPTLVSRLLPILHLVLQIPAREPWNSTRVAYLLTVTHVMVEYVTSLPLITLRKRVRKRDDDVEEEEPGEEQKEEDRRENEDAGKAMRCVLDLFSEAERGWIAVLDRKAWVQADGGCPVDVEDGAEVEITACVRLKSMVDLGRAKILAWARPYGDFPGEVMGPDGDEGEVVPDAAKVGWEAEVINVWKGIVDKLKDMEIE